MAEYWYSQPRFAGQEFELLKSLPIPEFVQNFELGAKDFVNAGKAAASIKFTLKQLGVDSQILRRTAIAAYEAEINITAHSYGGKIISRYYADCIHLIFDDDGPGMEDIERSIKPGFSTADELVREMGFGAG
ncbi:MAG TPA: ATP-binding protein, partial [Bacteroidetes bacterium]|nr:ATP-binding protein [Bacteroidota bacterium]